MEFVNMLFVYMSFELNVMLNFVMIGVDGWLG